MKKPNLEVAFEAAMMKAGFVSRPVNYSKEHHGQIVREAKKLLVKRKQTLREKEQE